MISSNPVLFTIMCVFGLQAMVLSGLIAFKKPKSLANTFLALLVFFYALIPINIVLANVLKEHDMLHVFRYIQLEMLYGSGPALYFYTKCISQPGIKFRKKDYLHFLPLVLEFIFYRTSIYRTGSNGLYLEEYPTSTFIYLSQQWLGVVSIFIYSFISLSILFKYQRNLKDYYSKIENLSLRWLITPVAIYFTYQIIWRIVSDVDRFVFDSAYREFYFLPFFVVLSVVNFWIAFKGYLFKEKHIVQLKKIGKKSEPQSVAKDEDFIKKLKSIMKAKRPYLNPELNLATLAQLLDIKPKDLSAKINQNCNQNFYDLINSYRVEAFKKRLKSSDKDKMSLLGHAYESGFNSKSTFNHVFKKITQQTPSQYFKKLEDTSE
jgi:AraC-like DNA-binding protein